MAAAAAVAPPPKFLEPSLMSVAVVLYEGDIVDGLYHGDGVAVLRGGQRYEVRCCGGPWQQLRAPPVVVLSLLGWEDGGAIIDDPPPPPPCPPDRFDVPSLRCFCLPVFAVPLLTSPLSCRGRFGAG